MGFGQYIEVEGKPVPCEDSMEWAKQFEKANRHVAQNEKDGVKVSTVFLGLDHAYGGGTPLLYETMVFGGDLDQEMDRYATREDAAEGHKRMCELVFKEKA